MKLLEHSAKAKTSSKHVLLPIVLFRVPLTSQNFLPILRTAQNFIEIISSLSCELRLFLSASWRSPSKPLLTISSANNQKIQRNQGTKELETSIGEISSSPQTLSPTVGNTRWELREVCLQASSGHQPFASHSISQQPQ